MGVCGASTLNFNSRPSARGDDSYRRHYRGVDEFQFTPLREGRHQHHQHHQPTSYFNSRPSARGDDQLTSTISQPAISIHAPPRGATLTSQPANQLDSHFNSRPSARGDYGTKWRCWEKEPFQFTPLREGRPRCSRRSSCDRGLFQFTPLREGRLMCAPIYCETNGISIHAPPRGATFRRREARNKAKISIHAPPRGATPP